MPVERPVTVNEVSLRDGLQIIKTIVGTDNKKSWCTRAAAAGFSEMEVTSLVPPALNPQFSDAAEMIAHANRLPSLIGSALVPNFRGAERGIEMRAAKLICIVSASESFNQVNLRRSRRESLDDLQRIVALGRALPQSRRPIVVAGISSAFGCSLEGRISCRDVTSIVEASLSAGVDEIVLADTTGSGDPAWVREMLSATRSVAGSVPVGVHFHDTRGTGLANVVAALECGIRRFDAALGGLGGCPNSPGATGNIATEDLVYMLEAMGLGTGIDLDALITLRRDIAPWIPGTPLHGKLSKAGLPTGFHEFRTGVPTDCGIRVN